MRIVLYVVEKHMTCRKNTVLKHMNVKTVAILERRLMNLVNANITPYEREHDVNHQYEHKDCPKSTWRRIAHHLPFLDLVVD